MPRKIKKHRKKKTKKKFLFLIILFSFGFIISYIFLIHFSNYQIKVINNNDYFNAQIIQFQNIIKNIPYFLIHKEKIKNKILSTFPVISDINLKFNFPKEFIFQIKEREPYILICINSEKNCFVCDKEGIIFLQTEKEKYNNLVYVIYNTEKNLNLGTKILSEDIIEKIIEINKYFLSELKINISKFYLSEDFILTVKTAEKWKGIFDLSENIKIQLIKLKLVLEQGVSEKERQNLEYIDLRFKKVYVK
ncbi:MAG: cell division protein FtsQ/DivIB [Minisyncoccia bacterium]